MRDPEPNHRLKGDMDAEQPRSFSETARELLEWRESEFSGRVFNDSASEGKEEIRDAFIHEEGLENNPEKLVRVMDFLASKMKINDGGHLRRRLNELRNGDSVSILPTDKKLTPSEVLRSLLTGDYDEKIDASEIAERGQAYTLVLYLYMHTSGDSEEEMADILSQLIRNYDDPSTNLYEHLSGVNREGISAVPELADLCAKTIEKHDLGQAMRERFKDVLSEEKSPDDDIDDKNIKLVFRKIHDIHSSS